MRIADRERFLSCCIFFIMIITLFSKVSFDYNKVLAKNKQILKNVYDSYKDKHKKNMFSNKKESYVIVLDAGHGGIDKGTSIGNLYEKDITLKIATFTKDYLIKQGHIVFMSRDKDILLSLRQIGDFVNEKNPNAFVSIHVNSFKKPEFKGITTYYYDVDGFQKDERIKFAKVLQKNACGNDIWEDRGIRRQNLAVLRYSKVPCVLLECGFITNLNDRKRLQDDEVLKITAQNIGNGIIDYLSNKQ